jgi:Rrf2 family protein
MMELTRKGEYAVRGIVYLATRPLDQVCLLSEIASAVDVPQTFLAKIFQQFSKIGLVRSYRGTGGGFVLGRSPENISLLEVVEAVEGPIAPNRCVIGEGQCDRVAGCNVHPVWINVQQQTRAILANVSLLELAGK